MSYLLYRTYLINHFDGLDSVTLAPSSRIGQTEHAFTHTAWSADCDFFGNDYNLVNILTDIPTTQMVAGKESRHRVGQALADRNGRSGFS